MAELNINQIINKLNKEFESPSRKLVFWYDSNGDFSEDISNITLNNAKLLLLQTNNQFYIKHLLEVEDTQTNYLIYAPFEKPDVKYNHLADTVHYSKEFFADKASLIAIDLGIAEKYRPILQNHIKFFGNKERSQSFYDLHIDSYNTTSIELGLLSTICKNKAVSFEEIMRAVILDPNLLKEFEKYMLLDVFWKHAESYFGYNSQNKSLEHLLSSMFISYISSSVSAKIPSLWKEFILHKVGNVIAFLDNFMNNSLYEHTYKYIAKNVYDDINAHNYFNELNTEAIVNCKLFENIDHFIIKWLQKRLENEDTGARLNNIGIDGICQMRSKMYFGNMFSNQYNAIQNAYIIISSAKYSPQSGIENIIKSYTQTHYKIDTAYRDFYYYYDTIDDNFHLESIKELVELIYTNEFLNPIIVNYNKELLNAGAKTSLCPQSSFFDNYIKHAKDRIIVIISDAMRYEVAYSLYNNLLVDEKCEANISAMQGVLPSYTPLGMASLLPYKSITYNDKYDVLLDSKPVASTEQREKQLQAYKPKSRCLQYDLIKNMNRNDLRDIFTGQDIIYIYHNQIDARGDSANTENEVFIACKEAIDEIHTLIRKLSVNTSAKFFYITADHGFIYKRSKIQTSHKISAGELKQAHIGQRYAISTSEINQDGILSLPLASVLKNSQAKQVYFPLASDIFMAPGAGQNYVHGGSSPQESLVPLISVRVEDSKVKTSYVQIALISSISKITNLITSMEFVQSQPVGDIVKPAIYKLYIISENNEIISNECIYYADSTQAKTLERVFVQRFVLKNRKYNNSQKNYLVIFNVENNTELSRYELSIDIAFDDYSFFVHTKNK